MDGFGTTPVTLLAYVTPGCGLCERIPGFLEAYTATASDEDRALLSFALATDAPEPEAERFRREHHMRFPVVRHPELKHHYGLAEVGAPYLLALANGEHGSQELLAGGIVNTLEQFEDLIEIALDHNSAHATDNEPLAATHGHTVGDRA